MLLRGCWASLSVPGSLGLYSGSDRDVFLKVTVRIQWVNTPTILDWSWSNNVFMAMITTQLEPWFLLPLKPGPILRRAHP